MVTTVLEGVGANDVRVLGLAVNRAEETVSWNIKMMLAAKGKSQAALSEVLGIQRATTSKKIRGLVAWSLADLVRAAAFLDTSVAALLDDSLMRQMQQLQSLNTKKTSVDNRPRSSRVPPERVELSLSD